MENFKVFIGEDFALLGEVEFGEDDSSQALADFDITAEMSTSALGNKILCSTMHGKGLEVVRREGNAFAVNVPHVVSRSMSAGEVVLSIALIHKASGVRSIAEKRTITLVESKLSKQI